jgi:hypothetical protein
MSKTMHRERTEPQEREFPYIPRGVPILQTGRAYNAYDNRSYVRQLLKHRNPAMSDRLEHEFDVVDEELTNGMITLDEAIFRLRIV